MSRKLTYVTRAIAIFLCLFSLNIPIYGTNDSCSRTYRAPQNEPGWRGGCKSYDSLCTHPILSIFWSCDKKSKECGQESSGVRSRERESTRRESCLEMAESTEEFIIEYNTERRLREEAINQSAEPCNGF